MKKTLIALLATASLTMGAYAIAGDTKDAICPDSLHHNMEGKGYKHGHHGNKGGHERLLKRMTKQLDLSETQVAAIKALHEQTKSDKPKHARKDGIMQLDPGAADYTAKVAEIAAAKAANVEQMIIARGKLHAQVFAVLTPEQQEKAKQLKARHMQKKDR